MSERKSREGRRIRVDQGLSFFSIPRIMSGLIVNGKSGEFKLRFRGVAWSFLRSVHRDPSRLAPAYPAVVLR